MFLIHSVFTLHIFIRSSNQVSCVIENKEHVYKIWLGIYIAIQVYINLLIESMWALIGFITFVFVVYNIGILSTTLGKVYRYYCHMSYSELKCCTEGLDMIFPCGIFKDFCITIY